MLHNVSNRYFLVSIIFILGSGKLVSQVNIKERVEIKPSPQVQTPTTKEAALFAEDPNPSGPAHVLVLHPCFVTATATIEMQGTPSSDLYVKTLTGGSMAWYNGYSFSPPQIGNSPVTFQIACGSIPIKMESTWEGIDIRSTTKTIGSNSASFVFQGMLSGCSYTVTAQLQATIDASYDIASMELTADTSQITQCLGTTTLHSQIRNNKGEEYTGVPCQNPAQPVMISVESTSEVVLSTPWQRGRSITLPYGDLPVNFIWNYRGETKNSAATVTLAVGTQTKNITINLVVDTTLEGIQFEDVSSELIHMMKTKVTVRGMGCGGMGSIPLPDGTSIDLAVIEGMNCGFLVDPETGRRGTHLSSLKTREGCVKAEYWAQGDELGGWVVLQAKSGPTVVELGMGIIGADLKLRLGRPTIGFGDTTSVVVERGNEDDGYSPIPSGWNTMYQVLEADTEGYFYTVDSSKTGSPLIGLYPETRFYAKNKTVNPDSLVLLLMVTSVEPYGGGGDKVKDGSGSVGRPVMLKTVGETRKAPKLSSGKVTSDMVEPPNLGNGRYHYGVAQLVVKKEEQLDHFKVTLEKDTIAYSEACKIFVQAKDAEDKDISLSDDQKLNYIFEGEESMYGRFIDAKGDTLLFVENAHYGDARLGLVRFAAVHQNPVNPITAKIKVVKAGDPTKSGEVDGRIVEQTMKLVLYGPREIWPVIPPFTQEKSHEDNRTLLEVQMTRNGKPLVGHPFKLTADYVIGSGGHDHTSYGDYDSQARPRTPQKTMFHNYGLFVSSQRNPSSANANPIEEKTIENGKAAFGYVASNFGDRMVIKAESKRSPLLFDTISIVEKIPDLELLPHSTDYNKVGGRTQHHGPSDKSEMEVPISCRTPDNNHWGMHSTIVALDSIVANHHRYYPSDNTLCINDVSLPLGGKFDINGSWSEEDDHDFHRLGRDADLRSSTITFREEFEEICSFFSVLADLEFEGESREHYHLYFWNLEE